MLLPEPVLILMCGLPFAGKTTLARQIVAYRTWRYLSLDAINTERGVGLDGQAISPHEWTQTYAEAYQRVQATLQARHSLVYDEANFLRTQRDQLRSIAVQTQVETYVLYVATTETEAQRRWQRNRTTRQRGDVRDDDFVLVVQQFEPPTADEHIILYDPTVPMPTWIAATFEAT